MIDFMVKNHAEHVGQSKGKFIQLQIFILPYRKMWSLSGPCVKGQGVLVGKTFENCLYMADDWKLPHLTDDWFYIFLIIEGKGWHALSKSNSLCLLLNYI